jgi:hypothetical protein
MALTSGRIKAVGTLACLGFITSIIASLIVSTCVSKALVGLGIVLILIAVLLIVLAVRTDDSKFRWLYVLSAAFGLIGGFSMCFETDELRDISHQLTLVVLYSITAIAISTALSFLYHFVTRALLESELLLAKVTESDETLIYFSVNLMTGFLVGVTVAVSNPAGKIDRLDGQGIAYSIGIWFLNAILMGLVGFKWTAEEGDMSSRYESASVPFAGASSYTDIT